MPTVTRSEANPGRSQAKGRSRMSGFFGGRTAKAAIPNARGAVDGNAFFDDPKPRPAMPQPTHTLPRPRPQVSPVHAPGDASYLVRELMHKLTDLSGHPIAPLDLGHAIAPIITKINKAADTQAIAEERHKRNVQAAEQLAEQLAHADAIGATVNTDLLSTTIVARANHASAGTDAPTGLIPIIRPDTPDPRVAVPPTQSQEPATVSGPQHPAAESPIHGDSGEHTRPPVPRQPTAAPAMTPPDLPRRSQHIGVPAELVRRGDTVRLPGDSLWRRVTDVVSDAENVIIECGTATAEFKAVDEVAVRLPRGAQQAAPASDSSTQLLPAVAG